MAKLLFRGILKSRILRSLFLEKQSRRQIVWLLQYTQTSQNSLNTQTLLMLQLHFAWLIRNSFLFLHLLVLLFRNGFRLNVIVGVSCSNSWHKQHCICTLNRPSSYLPLLIYSLHFIVTNILKVAGFRRRDDRSTFTLIILLSTTFGRLILVRCEKIWIMWASPLSFRAFFIINSKLHYLFNK